MKKKSLWILGITRGHNAGVCLLKDGKIIFSLEEERLSRLKYDGSPFATMSKVLEYTDTLDYIAISGTDPVSNGPQIEFIGDNVYEGLARKLGLIKTYKHLVPGQHPQVIDYGNIHHKLHAATAFYRSGFSSAAALIVDGAGSIKPLTINGQEEFGWEVESILNCSYPNNFSTLYKHIGFRGNIISGAFINDSTEYIATERPGIVKAYEAVTEYCGFQGIEAGKTMGLSSYGKPNDKIPEIFDRTSTNPLVSRNLITPMYPASAIVNSSLYEYLDYEQEDVELSLLENRRDLAYALQEETQKEVFSLIRKAVEMSGQNNIVISGGYGLNCVANYYYLEEAKKEGINIYVEPISNDAGTAMGAALYHHAIITDMFSVDSDNNGLYLGPIYDYTNTISTICESDNIELTDTNTKDIVKLLRDKNIVSIFQGRSENGPRALGNRSILFDPTFEDGKDFVNSVKHREYFRPFAGSVLKEHAHEWFDLRGMEESPHMMYAVNCQEGMGEKIPSIIHVDGTCRIQTVSKEQNNHFYELINEYYKETGIPVLFNTSFNLAGEPLVETLEDAIKTLVESDIEYLYMPEYKKLIHIKN